MKDKSTERRSYRFLGLLTAAYITFQLVSDITAGKIIELFVFPVSVTVLYFPITYVFGDVLTEVYGYGRSRSVIWKVFFASVLAGVIFLRSLFISHLPLDFRVTRLTHEYSEAYLAYWWAVGLRYGWEAY